MSNYMTTEAPQINEEVMPINGTDYIELYVSNSKQAAYYYKSALVFKVSLILV